MYKKYLWDPSVKVPRCTLLKRRRRAAARLQERNAREAEQNNNLNDGQELELHGNLQFPPCSSSSSTSSDEHSSQNLNAGIEASNRRKKRARRQPVPRLNVGALANEEEVSSSSSSSSDLDHMDNESHLGASDVDNISNESEGNEVEEEEAEVILDIENREPKVTICPCSNLTSDDVVIMVVSLAIRHSLSWAAQVDVLNLINTIYNCDKVPATKYLYKNQIGHKQPGTAYHVYCSNRKCNKYLGNKAELEETVTCECSQLVKVQETQSFFVSLSLEDQFKELFQKESVVESLFSYRFNRKKKHPENFEDVYDGALYQKHFSNNGILANPHNFSYSFNTDGMPIGKSSHRTLWPIYLTINELPPHERDRYVLLAGLYCGHKDPNQTMFLTPFVQQANELSSTGFSWTYKGSQITSLVLPLCAVVDSVARYQMLNMAAFNSFYGCTFCYHKTVRTRKGQKYLTSSDAVPLRTRESTISDCNEAFFLRNETDESKRKYKGVKGPSPLLFLDHFSLISGFIPDYMHAILQGVIKSHMGLLFDSKRKKFWIGMEDHIAMGHVINALDARLLSFAPPKIVTRLPRTLHEMANWKASEWRGWLVLYCIPCVQGILKPKHVTHLALLCTATSILLKQSISKDEVSQVLRLLLRYVFLYQKYFGEEEMNYNEHLLLHIPDQVLNWGPIYTHNCFLYEGQNRLMLLMCHSPNQIVKQLVCKFLTYGSLPQLVHKFNTGKEALKYCEQILNRSLKKVRNVDNVRLVGTGKIAYLNEVEDVALQRFKNFDEDVLFYDKMFFKKCKFTTKQIAFNKKRNNAYVLVSGSKFGQIRGIFTDNKRVYVLIKLFEVGKVRIDDFMIPKTFLPFNAVTAEGELFVAPLSKIRNVAMYCCTTEGSYLCEVPFGCWSGY